MKYGTNTAYNYNYIGDLFYQLTLDKTCRELTESHAATVGEGANCAPGYCLAYQAEGDYYKNKKWALPGIREWLAIYKHIDDINKAL